MDWRAQGRNSVIFKCSKDCHSEEGQDMFFVFPKSTTRSRAQSYTQTDFISTSSKKCLMTGAAQMWNKVNRSVFPSVKASLSPLSVHVHSKPSSLLSTAPNPVIWRGQEVPEKQSGLLSLYPLPLALSLELAISFRLGEVQFNVHLVLCLPTFQKKYLV